MNLEERLREEEGHFFGSIWNAVMNVGRVSLLAGTLAVTSLIPVSSGCGNGDTFRWSPEIVPYSSPLMDPLDPSVVIADPYGVSVQIEDSQSSFDFKRFSLDQSPLFPPVFPRNRTIADLVSSISRLVVTIRDDRDIYHVIWIRDLDVFEQNPRIFPPPRPGAKPIPRTATAYLKNGQIIQGTGIMNTTPLFFYNIHTIRFPEGYYLPSGTLDEDGVETPKTIGFGSLCWMRIDPSHSFSDFDAALSTVLSVYHSPKTVELTDGTIYQTDFAYILDACGHWWKNTSHTKLLDTCDLIEPNGSGYLLRQIPLSNLQTIEPTGGFLPMLNYSGQQYATQCREVMLTYKSGAARLSWLELSAESHNGQHTYGQTYKNFDRVVVFTDTGAVFIPFENVRRIILP